MLVLDRRICRMRGDRLEPSYPTTPTPIVA